MTLDELRTLVDEMVRDQHQVVEPAARDRAIDLALARYGEEIPRRESATLTWAVQGSRQALPAEWTAEHAVLHVELVQAGRSEVFTRFVVHSVPGGFELELTERELPAQSQVFVAWACPHVPGSIHRAHREAVAAYAAHLLCAQLAAYFSGEREAAIGADASQTESRARNYAARAKELRALYFAGVGARDPAADGTALRPAAAVAVWPARNPRHQLAGRPTFRHGIR